MPDVTFTVDGQKLTAPAGTLLIEACKTAGIEIPAFCYYPGLSLQAACRMCVVRIEKVPKLATACTTTVAEGMVVQTETPEIAQAPRCSCCSAIIPSTAPYAMPAASVNCRT
jgi:NADH-quinone oxidoreductase subunit G